MIYLQLKGRLGNQMFIYAFAHTLSKQNNDEPICFIDGTQSRLINYNIENVTEGATYKPSLFRKGMMFLYSLAYDHDFNKSDKKLMSKVDNYIYKHLTKRGIFVRHTHFVEYNRNMCGKEDIYVNGYFQCEKYFDEYQDDILRMYTPKDLSGIDSNAFYQKIKADNESVCVDFRIGDYKTIPLLNVCSINYYIRAMELMKEKLTNPTFYVFSTDIDDVKKSIEESGHSFNVVFEDGKAQDFEKLAMMSACRNFIITNSTYDWWGQYLSKNPQKIVIAPSRWLNSDYTPDIYQDNWIKIDT